MPTPDPNKTVFISYRRSVSRNLARSIFMDLRAHDYDVFMDVQSIDAGTFDQIILNQIGARAHFIVLISIGSLKRCANSDDWLRREIEEALSLKRNIVPILEEGADFEMETSYLPDNWREEFKRYNSIPLYHFYFDAAMDILRTRFLKKPFSGSVIPTPAKERQAVERKIKEAIRQIEWEFDPEVLLKQAHIIEDVLTSFASPGRVVQVNTGPTVTQFAVEPDYILGRGGKRNRVKVSAIAALEKDLQLALEVKSIRIEAPVPGKNYVGIEVPHTIPQLVKLRDVLESDAYRNIQSPLGFALGMLVDGTPFAADLSSMPHLLIAGMTGSGKSILINALIVSLLLKTPKQVKLVLLDSRRVELTQYNGISNLVAPVVVELERSIPVLKWVAREMDVRYQRFTDAGVRNIDDFRKHPPATEKWMPYIVVIINEFADLMIFAPEETENLITRLTALGGATGIHLVIATQRPWSNIVTDLIKSNIPARIALTMASKVDSYTILEQYGAEQLLGHGDMLYKKSDSPVPIRLQGVFVSDDEIASIINLRRTELSEKDRSSASQPIDVSSNTVLQDGDDSDERTNDLHDEDEMYEQAVELVRRLNKASVSLLQRRLRIGYSRAARLIDTLEERGIVGPATQGSKPREVLPFK